MTIDEIAKSLDNCANRRCGDCKYYLHTIFQNYGTCVNSLIEDMANECRHLSDQMGDDGK